MHNLHTPNAWEELLTVAVVKFSPYLPEDDRDEACGMATEIAQEVGANVAEKDMPQLIVCCPALLLREPEDWQDVVASREYASASPFWFAQMNIVELLERHLEETWNTHHGYRRQEDNDDDGNEEEHNERD